LPRRLVDDEAIRPEQIPELLLERRDELGVEGMVLPYCLVSHGITGKEMTEEWMVFDQVRRHCHRVILRIILYFVTNNFYLRKLASDVTETEDWRLYNSCRTTIEH
jgi:hypothetical protein